MSAAIGNATDGDTIEIGAGTYTENLDFFLDLTLRGVGASQTILEGSAGDRTVSTSGVTTLQGLTITREQNDESGETFGGGVSTSNALPLIDCVVTGNHNGGGGGVLQSGGTLTLIRTVVSNNTGPSDCVGTLDSLGHNLIQETTGCTITGDLTGSQVGVDPGLRPLGLHGGTTPNHELMAGSPALDAGSPDPVGFGDQACLAADQRLQSRPVDGNGDDVPRCDIGAIESSLFFADGFESGNTNGWTTVVP